MGIHSYATKHMAVIVYKVSSKNPKRLEFARVPSLLAPYEPFPATLSPAHQL